MALTLKAVSYKGLPPLQAISARFDAQGGSIGRAPDNHLVLPDPEKFVSRLHARILFQHGGYFLQDSSTGGTYLAHKDLLLQQNQIALENGEILRVGEYELAVSIDDVAPSGFTPIVRQLDLTDNALLDSAAVLGNPTKPPDGFYSSFVEQADSAVFHQSFTPPEVASAPPLASDDLDFGDLLSTLDALPGSQSVKTPDLPVLPDDFFADDEPVSTVSSPVAARIADQVEVLASHDFGLDPFAVAETHSPAAADFAVSGFEPQALVTELFEPSQSMEQEPVVPTADPFAEMEPVIAEQHAVESNLFQSLPSGENTFAATSQISPLEPRAETPPVTVAPVIVEPIAAAVASAKPQPAQLAVAADSELLKQFLAGAGIDDPHFLPPEQWPALMRSSGELLRSLMEGLMLVLRARAELKSQFRVSVTTMRAVNNNPLKFTPSVDDAIKLMLAPTHPGFLAPKEAVREGFSDIMNHQMAMTAGIQAALAEILHGFDPVPIEKTQGEGVLFQKKAKCWEYYVERYPQLKTVAQEEFFGDAFVDAYEKQMVLLSRSSNPQ